MSTSYSPPPSVAFQSELSWILKEPVLVTWQDRYTGEDLFLGQPTPTNKDVPLTLWVGRGYDQGRDQLVIMLQLTISYYVSARKKSMTMFLLASDLSVDRPGDFSPITLHDLKPMVCRHIRHTYPDMLDQKRFIQLAVRSTLSQVVMPVRSASALTSISTSTSHPKQIRGTALHLVLLLKSLSEAVSFDAYMGYSSYAVTALNNVVVTLGRPHTIPAVDLQLMYNSNGGAYNAWEQYLDQKAATRVGNHVPNPRHPPKRKRARTRDPSPLCREEPDPLNLLPPPPYTDKTGRAQSLDSSESSPSNPIVVVPQSDPACSPERLTSESTGEIIPETPQARPLQHTSSVPPSAGIASDALMMPRTVHHVQSQQLDDYDGSAQVIQIQLLSSHHSNHSPVAENVKSVGPCAPVSHLPPAGGTQGPTPTEANIQALPAPSRPPLRQRAPYCLTHLPLASDYEPVRRKDDVSDTLQVALTNWIYEMRKVHRVMHELPEVFTLLMAFGPAIHNKNVAQFYDLKARCTAIVLRESTMTPGSGMSTAAVTAETPQRRVVKLIRWLYACILDIETVMMDDMKELSQRAAAWTKRLQDCRYSDREEQLEDNGLAKDKDLPEEREGDEEAAYSFFEATCISKTCILFGYVLTQT